MGRQKELDSDPKAIQKIEFAGKLRNIDGTNADKAQNIFFKQF